MCDSRKYDSRKYGPWEPKFHELFEQGKQTAMN